MKTTAKKVSSYNVRKSHFGDMWIAESPRGISTQHESKELAVKYVLKRAEKVIYTQPK